MLRSADLHFWWMLEHNAVIHLNLALSRQEVRHRNNNMTSGFLTPAHKSQKRDKHKLSDYGGNSSISRHQLSTELHRGGLKTQPVGVGGRRTADGGWGMAEQNRI